MKKVLFAIAAVAMLVATSCNKDNNAPEDITLGENEFLATIDNSVNSHIAPRISDGMTTKTTIDTNRYVIWSNGDMIKINGVAYVTGMSGNSVKFSPATTGQSAEGSDFHAFYPATIAGTGAAGKLPATQVFNAAELSNLPMYAYSTTKQLKFHNICAVLKITIPSFVDGSTSIVVSSKQVMNGSFTVDANNTAVMAEATADSAKKVTVRKSTGSFATGDVVYVAVPAQSYDSLKVEFFNGTTATWYNMLVSATLEVSKIYPLNLSEHPYVDLGLPSHRKWATCNVGAVYPWDYGDYFAWGETEPYYETMTFSADRLSATFTWKSGKTAGYAWDSYRYGGVGATTGTYDMTKYNTTDGKLTLDTLGTIDDAARFNWGTKWHMPDSADWEELKAYATWVWQDNYKGTGVKGFLVTSTTDASKFIFLPATGSINGTTFSKGGKISSGGSYWSSSRRRDLPERAYLFGFFSTSYYTDNTTRNFGRTVRPVCQ